MAISKGGMLNPIFNRGLTGLNTSTNTDTTAPTIAPTIPTRKPPQPPAIKIYNDDPNANLREALLQANERMGTAHQGVLNSQRANLFAGFDTGFGQADDNMQSSMAKRGITGSGVHAKAITDLGRERMAKSAGINNQAYNQAVQAGDTYRQQRMANLTGYAQLGRGMSGSAQNYLGQAGGTYGQIGGQAGQTAIGLGGLNNSYNSAKWNAQAQASQGKGQVAGAGIGAAATMFSDMRLKKNVKALCKINGFQIVQWDWNEEGIRVAGNAPTVGVIAQEAAKVDPTAVSVNKETGYLQVDYNKVFTGVRNG